MTKPDMQLWLSDNRGQFIPRDFATSFADRAKHVEGVSDETWATLEAGPDSEWYWESWESVLDHARVTDEHGVKYRLWQDGDLWLIPDGMEFDDASETFYWPESEDDESK